MRPDRPRRDSFRDPAVWRRARRERLWVRARLRLIALFRYLGRPA